MKISILLPTRSRPALLKQSVEALWTTLSSSDYTTILVGIDTDDPDTAEAVDSLQSHNCDVHPIFMPRPDTMGAKYNALAAALPADLYIAWADDVLMSTVGWDEILRQYARYFGPEPGFVFSGQPGMVGLPDLYGMNHAMLESLGYFAPEWFPNWWCETWITEIALLSQRVVYTDPKITYAEAQAGSPTGRGRTQGLRDLAFWVEFFEATREIRKEHVRELLVTNEPAWRRVGILPTWPWLCQAFEQVFTSKLRSNPAYFERAFCIDETSTDPRYVRAKDKALQWLNRNPESKKAFPSHLLPETASTHGTSSP